MVNKLNKYLKEAYEEAIKAYKKKEVPVGAIIVKDGKIIAKAHNLREIKKNSLAHAEIICINKACKKLRNWRLDNCVMYVTLYPCEMCMGAIKQSVIDQTKTVFTTPSIVINAQDELTPSKINSIIDTVNRRLGSRY